MLSADVEEFGVRLILEGMQKVRRMKVWRKTGKKMLPRVCVCVCVVFIMCVCVCVPSHCRSYFRCKEKLPCVCVCVCKGNPPLFNGKKGLNSGPSQLTDGCSPCGKCETGRRVCVCVCVCARSISLVTHEKEPRLTVVHTLQEKCGVYPVSLSYLLSM